MTPNLHAVVSRSSSANYGCDGAHMCSGQQVFKSKVHNTEDFYRGEQVPIWVSFARLRHVGERGGHPFVMFSLCFAKSSMCSLFERTC